MDVSPVKSGLKCSSDFSIERILSEDSRDREDNEAPSWLCCTRYRPPRVPRAAIGGGSRARRSGRHARVPFTAAQASALEAAYSRAPYLAPPALRALAAALQLRDDRIKIWFQNRRARERREKCAIITPPQAVTLPATGPTLISANHWYRHQDMQFTPQPNRCQNKNSFGTTNSQKNTNSSFPASLFHHRHYRESDDNVSDERRSDADSPLDVVTVDS